MSYKKSKKKDLIKLIEEQQELISLLETNNKQIIILDSEKDDKQLIYLKNRIKVIYDTRKLNIYKKELDRLLTLRQTSTAEAI